LIGLVPKTGGVTAGTGALVFEAEAAAFTGAEAFFTGAAATGAGLGFFAGTGLATGWVTGLEATDLGVGCGEGLVVGCAGWEVCVAESVV
jgi:hypothetical protein